MEEQSVNEQRIRKIIQMYYSRPEIQKAIFEFSKDREVVPRYFEGFGKRPDAFQYQGDLFELVKKGATSFHCSEELWSDPMKLATGMNLKDLHELRKGWDFLIDIDSKYIDYSKVMAEQLIKFLKFHGIKNIGMKFSGSKGFHVIIPWKAFPKEVNGVKTKDMFPEWPRIIINYISEKIHKELVKEITKISMGSEYVRDYESSKEVIPDLVLVSSRHLFRAPYSLHEKTSLVSMVIDANKVKEFQHKEADALSLTKEKVIPFIPNSQEGEARELLTQALDWHKENYKEEKITSKLTEYSPIKITNFSETMLSPSIQKILLGVGDGRKRALFVLINLFRAIGLEPKDIEEKVRLWNEKNEVPLKWGYIKAQLMWSYKNKIILPPNFDKDYYKGIGIQPTPEEIRFKNPVNYVVKKSSQEKPADSIKAKDSFKKNN